MLKDFARQHSIHYMKHIPLTRGAVTVVDDDVFDEHGKYKWCCAQGGYAVRTICAYKNNRQVKLHRLIMNAQPGQHVDHINGDKLDNRRCNLRFATSVQNSWNSAPMANSKVPFRGVWEQAGKFAARITCFGKRHLLGFFPDAKTAALAYDFKARELYGPYARLNFPDENVCPVRPPKRSPPPRTTITAFGETKLLTEWEADPRCVVSARTLRSRAIERGWDVEDAITRPIS